MKINSRERDPRTRWHIGCAAAWLGTLIAGGADGQALTNPHFATPYVYYDSNTSVATGWGYFRELQNPKFQQSTFEQMPGGPSGQVSCQQIWADWSSYKAGIYQRVTGCTPGAAYYLSGWCMSIYQHGVSPTPPQGNNISQKLGIDPYGGTDPLSANVVWAADDWQDRTWRMLMTSGVVARGSAITVFARTYNVWAKTNCLSFYDAFNLVKVRDISYDRATVEWDTLSACNSRVDYGLTSAYGMSVTDSSLVTHHVINLTGLSRGTTYHFKVSFTNPGSGDILRDSTFATMDGNLVASVAEAKGFADGTRVIIADVSVTATGAQLGDRLYVEEPDGSCGIQVSSATAGPANIGDRLDVNGTLATSNGERNLYSATTAVLSAGQPALKPAALTNDAVGGARLNAYSPGVENGTGPNTIGLLARVWGIVRKLDTAGKFFYVDDGAGLLDGSGHTGVRVAYGHIASFTPPAEGKYAILTGIVSTMSIAGKNVPRLMPRQQSDLVVF